MESVLEDYAAIDVDIDFLAFEKMEENVAENYSVQRSEALSLIDSIVKGNEPDIGSYSIPDVEGLRPVNKSDYLNALDKLDNLDTYFSPDSTVSNERREQQVTASYNSQKRFLSTVQLDNMSLKELLERRPEKGFISITDVKKKRVTKENYVIINHLIDNELVRRAYSFIEETLGTTNGGGKVPEWLVKKRLEKYTHSISDNERGAIVFDSCLDGYKSALENPRSEVDLARISSRSLVPRNRKNIVSRLQSLKDKLTPKKEQNADYGVPGINRIDDIDVIYDIDELDWINEVDETKVNDTIYGAEKDDKTRTKQDSSKSIADLFDQDFYDQMYEDSLSRFEIAIAFSNDDKRRQKIESICEQTNSLDDHDKGQLLDLLNNLHQEYNGIELVGVEYLVEKTYEKARKKIESAMASLDRNKKIFELTEEALNRLEILKGVEYHLEDTPSFIDDEPEFQNRIPSVSNGRVSGYIVTRGYSDGKFETININNDGTCVVELGDTNMDSKEILVKRKERKGNGLVTVVETFRDTEEHLIGRVKDGPGVCTMEFFEDDRTLLGRVIDRNDKGLSLFDKYSEKINGVPELENRNYGNSVVAFRLQPKKFSSRLVSAAMTAAATLTFGLFGGYLNSSVDNQEAIVEKSITYGNNALDEVNSSSNKEKKSFFSGLSSLFRKVG